MGSVARPAFGLLALALWCGCAQTAPVASAVGPSPAVPHVAGSLGTHEASRPRPAGSAAAPGSSSEPRILAVPDDRLVPEQAVVVSLIGRDSCPIPPRRAGGIPVVRLGAAPPGAYCWFIVRRIVRLERQTFAPCFAASPTLKACRNATVNVQMTIARDGSVPSVHAVARDPHLAACTRAALRSIRFPAPGAGSVELEFPIRYRAVLEGTTNN